MHIDDLLLKKVSYQNQYWKEIVETDIKTVLNEIKGDRHKAFTIYLTSLYVSGDESYGARKKFLPVATFCGLFENERTKERLKEYNSIMILDIDKLGKSELGRVRKVLNADNYVFAFWESPSKDGIKGLVCLNFGDSLKELSVDTKHKEAFVKLADYFKKNHSIELDKSGSDITRLCFVSWDDNLVLKSDFIPFDVTEITLPEYSVKVRKMTAGSPKPLISNTLYNPAGKNNTSHKKSMQNIISYLTKNSKSITFNYDDWYKVGFAVANSFTFDIGLKYFKELSKLDFGKYNELDCENFLKSCYTDSKGIINFKFIINVAIKQGFKYRNTEST